MFPGGLLPLVLGKLPFEPMLLSTESMPATPGVSPGLILLRLDPAFDLPRTLPGSREPMRCWNIMQSGCGESSRWYVDEKGKLQAVAFAGESGVAAQRVAPRFANPTCRGRRRDYSIVKEPAL